MIIICWGQWVWTDSSQLDRLMTGYYMTVQEEQCRQNYKWALVARIVCKQHYTVQGVGQPFIVSTYNGNVTWLCLPLSPGFKPCARLSVILFSRRCPQQSSDDKIGVTAHWYELSRVYHLRTRYVISSHCCLISQHSRSAVPPQSTVRVSLSLSK